MVLGACGGRVFWFDWGGRTGHLFFLLLFYFWHLCLCKHYYLSPISRLFLGSNVNIKCLVAVKDMDLFFGKTIDGDGNGRERELFGFKMFANQKTK